MFFAYFKAVDTPVSFIKPPVLPIKPPERQGFTAVDWGGVID
jgi:hypothetical protein